MTERSHSFTLSDLLSISRVSVSTSGNAPPLQSVDTQQM